MDLEIKGKKAFITGSTSGIGFDTHRYWESLLVKTIPIVITSNLINHYKDLGIQMLILSNWSEIYDFTEKELNKIQ